MTALVAPPFTLQPGDVQLFRGSGLMGFIVRQKTWSDVGHVEVYMGDGLAATARSDGVRLFPVRDDHCYVYRPVASFNREAALIRFKAEADGQGYDWLGLVSAFIARRAGHRNKMFCSECVTRVLRWGGVDVFEAGCDADSVSPAQFKQTPALRRVWCREGGCK